MASQMPVLIQLRRGSVASRCSPSATSVATSSRRSMASSTRSPTVARVPCMTAGYAARPIGDDARPMNDLQIVLAALFVSAAGLNALANWVKVPYPIPLVLGGLVLGFLPGIPDIQLDPDLVLLVFLPPLLYAGAFFADLRTLRDDARVISLNAIGLVL